MNRLKVLILHHHMRGGGVTEVIRRTFALFQDSEIQLALITGEEKAALRDIPATSHRYVDGLSYGDSGIPVSPEKVYEDCLSAAVDMFGETPDVWHIHNHSLGKNAVYTAVALRLIREGKKVILHTHDFAEDNRPGNYRLLGADSEIAGIDVTAELYPVAQHIRYATLNQRDAGVLESAGVDRSLISVIANPVTTSFSGEVLDKRSDTLPDNLILYPVRAIPRKNIGELVLWSALYKKEAVFGITLAPKNPVYATHYKDWVRFAKEKELPMVFEAGKYWNCSYRELISGSKALITTSLAEGFGLVFLEGFLMNKPLVGRDLPAISSDFKEDGVSLQGLYPRLPVPVDWIGKERLEMLLSNSIGSLFEGYRRDLSGEQLADWLAYLLTSESVDFGVLNAELQMEVILQVLEDDQKADQLRQYALVTTDQPVADNRVIVQDIYSGEAYKQRLLHLYRDLAESMPTEVHFASPEKVLDGFLSPASFSLLRQ